MNEDLIHVINLYLLEKQGLVNLHNRLTNYSELQDQVLQRELLQEIKALKAMLASPSTFVDRFKARCAWREMHPEQTIPFSALPETATNQLYWELAMIIFEPQSMQEMLNIIMPGVKHQLTVIWPEIIPPGESLRSFAKNVSPQLQKLDSLDALNNPPMIVNLSHYVIAEQMLFNVDEVVNLPLEYQHRVKECLSQFYPNLAKALYEHNHSFQTLLSDINLYAKVGMPPREAIERLIIQLRLGGKSINSGFYATAPATLGVIAFFSYFENLPKKTQDGLKALDSGYGKTLATIINWILNQECVEVTAIELRRLLNKHAKNSLLDSPPAISPDALKSMQRKYKLQSMDSIKDNNVVLLLPEALTRTTISLMEPLKTIELYDLLINFQPEFYDMLWSQLLLQNPSQQLNDLATYIRNGYPNPEQEHALAKAIAKYYHRFPSERPIIEWTVLTESLLFCTEALAVISENNRLAAITNIRTVLGKTFLHSLTSNSEFISEVLLYLPEQDRLTAVMERNYDGTTIIHSVADSPEFLRTILVLLPEHDRLKAVMAENHAGNTAMHLIANRPESLKVVLALIPVQDRLAAVLAEGYWRRTVMSYIAINTASVKATFELLLEQDRLKAVLAEDNRRRPVLFSLCSSLELLKAVLALIPEQDRLAAIMAKNRDGITILQSIADRPKWLKAILALIPEKDLGLAIHLVTHNPVSLQAALSLIPAQDRLNAITEKNSLGIPLIHLVAAEPELLKTILELLPEQDRLAAVKTKNNRHIAAMDHIAGNPASLQATLVLLPERYRLESFYIHGATIIRALPEQPELFNTLLALVPEKDRQRAVLASLQFMANKPALLRAALMLIPERSRLKAINHSGNTLMYSIVDKPELLKIVLELLPEQDRLKAVLIEDNLRRAVMFSLYNSPASLQAVLTLLPEQDRLAAVMAKERDGTTFMDYIAYRRESLKVVLNFLCTKDKLTAIRVIDKEYFVWRRRQIVGISAHLMQYEINTIISKKTEPYLKIKAMREYGIRLKLEDKEKGVSVINLANSLDGELDNFYARILFSNRPRKAEINVFISKFKTLLHSQDEMMQTHRAPWDVILANIFLSICTLGLSLIGMGINALCTYYEKQNLTMNNVLFFARTTREELIDGVEKTLNTTNFSDYGYRKRVV